MVQTHKVDHCVIWSWFALGNL